jgi:single-stranded DNA-binding protein
MISLNLTGRLTREPELRRVPDPSSDGQLDVCQIRVAARTRRGETVYLDLSEWGASGRAAAERLSKGSMIAFTGELRFREQSGEMGTRQYLSGVGHIEFLDGRSSSGAAAGAPSGPAANEDDIPF